MTHLGRYSALADHSAGHWITIAIGILIAFGAIAAAAVIISQLDRR